MASRQATTALIRTADFRNNTISFPVESVLGIGQGTGHLLIEVSAGYVLTTPTNTNPQLRQSIPYVLQPNGTHVVHAVVTLLATELPLMPGTVTLRNPIGETSILPIDAETNADVWAASPVLTLSTENLTFAKTGPGDEEYALLKVGQQGTDTLITLTSDDPANFLIAIGVEELRFTSTVSFVPAPVGTFVHVRYAPDRSGQHTARLFVETSFDTRTVLLRGRASGLLPTLPQRQPKPNREPLHDAQPSGSGRLWRTMVLIVAGGLAGLGYVYRCELAPELCQAPATLPPAAQSSELVPDRKTPAEPVEKPLVTTRKRHDIPDDPADPEVTRSTTKRKKAEPESSEQTESKALNRSSAETAPQPEEKPERTGTKSSTTSKRAASVTTEPVVKKRKAAAPPVVPNPTDESDLEKALNKKSENP